MKKPLTILINTLGLLFLLLPGVAVAERILNYSILYLFYKISENPILLTYVIAGFTFICLFVIFSIYVQVKKQQIIYILILFIFSILIGAASGYFNFRLLTPTQDWLFFIYSVFWIQIIMVLALLGKIKDYTFGIIQSNIKSRSYAIYRIFAYAFLIFYYINRFSEFDEAASGFIHIQNNLIVQVLSIAVSLIFFGNAENIVEKVAAKTRRLREIFKISTEIEREEKI